MQRIFDVELHDGRDKRQPTKLVSFNPSFVFALLENSAFGLST